MDGETEDLIAQEYLEVQNDVNRLRELAIDDETSKPLGKGTVTYQDLDFHALIEMRFQHQTRQAAAGVRTKDRRQNENPAETLRKKIIRRCYKKIGLVFIFLLWQKHFLFILISTKIVSKKMFVLFN